MVNPTSLPLLLLLYTFASSFVQCDITNVNELLDYISRNGSTEYAVGALSQANIDVVKRIFKGKPKFVVFADKNHLLEGLSNGTIILAVSTGAAAQDIGADYHVFSSLIISPQAMLLAPDYEPNSAPYGLNKTSSQDLFDALNAAIIDMQNGGTDETIFSTYNRIDVVRSYTCRSDRPINVRNRNETRGILRDILTTNRPLRIGGIGPRDWGLHDGNYSTANPHGMYPALLESIVDNLAHLRGSDDIPYSEKITFQRKYYFDTPQLLRALLDGEIDATDVYLLIDAPYAGSQTNCTNNTVCRPEETCDDGKCQYPSRPRSLHFRSTCTIASRDTKFITLKDTTKKNSSSMIAPPAVQKTRWVAFLLLFAALFGTIFLTLLILIRRKKSYRMQATLPGGLGKFARLREEEGEPPMDAMDSFDDQIVQSPRETTQTTS